MNIFRSHILPVARTQAPPRNIVADEHTNLPAGAIISVLRSKAALVSIADDWRALGQEAGNNAGLFQSYGWISQWLAQYETALMDVKPLIIVGYQSGRLVFVWPLMKSRSHGLDVIEWLTSPSGQYGDIVLAPGLSPSDWQEAALKLLKRSESADLLRLRHVRVGSAFHAFAERHMLDASSPESAPYMELSAFKTEADYEARYNSSQRKRRKKIRKELEAFGEVEFKRLSPGTETDRAIAAAIDEKTKWLEQRGRINRIMSCPLHMSFLQSLARNPSPDVETVVTEITAGGKPVSWEIGFRCNGTHFGYITSHVNEMTDYSPGRLHMHYSQLLALKDGMQRFDLMVPNDVHKESWSSDMVHTNDYYLPMSRMGQLVGETYLRLLRPMLRSAYYKLAPNALRFLKPITRRLT
jgi:CelD/BcsL family acetyltransferase involved in cellulose biosynthesis